MFNKGVQSKLYWYAYIEDNNFAAVEDKIIAGVSVQKRAKAVFGGHTRKRIAVSIIAIFCTYVFQRRCVFTDGNAAGIENGVENARMRSRPDVQR